METTPVPSVTRTAKVRTAKNAVPKSSSPAAEPDGMEPAAAAPRKRKAVTKKVAEPAPATAAVTTADMTPMIATAAYFLAEQRQFAPGYEMQDWLAAEQLVCGSAIAKSAMGK